jgi:hypothetical protein
LAQTVCKTTPDDVQAESNVREDLYGLEVYVVDC